MSVYAIYLSNQVEEARNDLVEKWPSRHFVVEDRLILVAPEEVITTTKDVATVAGLGEDKGRLGVVFEITARSGFHKSEMWEWLRKVEA